MGEAHHLTDKSGRLSCGSLSRRSALAGLAASLAAAGCSKAQDAGAAAARPVVTPPVAPRARPQPRDVSYEVVEVGPGKRFASLTLAGVHMNSIERWNNGYTPPEKLARMGFRVVISPGPPGYYVNDSGSHSRRWKALVGWPPYEGQLMGPVIVEGEPGKPAPVLETDGHADGVLYYQSGLFATGNFDAVFRRLIFRGFRRRDGGGNYAALRLGQNNLNQPLRNQILIEDCEFTGCDNGIMGGSPGQQIVLRRSYFHDNGNASGFVHNAYIGAVDELVVEDVLSTRCVIGHLLKTRAARTIIRNSRLLGGGGTESACLDTPNGGVLDVQGLVCEKSAKSDAIWLIHYGGENQDEQMAFHAPSSIRLRDLALVGPERLEHRRSWGRVVGFANQSGLGPKISGRGSHLIAPDAEDVRTFGLARQSVGLPSRQLAQAPPLDRRSPVKI